MLNQHEVDQKLFTVDVHILSRLRNIDVKSKLGAAGLTTLRGVDSSLQWLVSDPQTELGGNISLSASCSSNPTIGSLQRANNRIRPVQRDDTLPINMHAIPLDQLNLGILSNAARGARPDGSSQGIPDLCNLTRIA